MNSYIHNQTTPSAEWLVVHNLDTYPVSDVIIDDDDRRLKTLPLALEYINSNSVLVRFSAPMTGTIRLVGLYKYELNPVEPEIPVDPVDPEPVMYDIFLDTFNGSGDMTGHVSDNGVIWDTEWQPLTTMLLGGGDVYPDPAVGGNLHSYMVPQGITLPETFNIEVELNVVSTEDAFIEVGFRGAPGLSGDGTGYSLEMQFYDDTAVYSNFYNYEGDTSEESTIPTAGGTHTLLIEVTPTLKRAYLDTTLLGTWSGADGGFGQNGVLLRIQQNIRVSRMHVYTSEEQTEEPPVNNIVFKDTFSGAASNLVGRVPDVGPTWGDISDYPSFLDYAGGATPAALANYETDGNGGMWANSTENQGSNLAIPKMMPAFGYFDYKFVVTNALAEGESINLFYNGAIDVPFVNGVPDEENWASIAASIEFNINGSTFELGYSGSSEYTPSGFRNDVVGITMVPGVEYTWRWETSVDGLKMFLSDGTTTVQILHDTGVAQQPNWETTAFAFGDSGPGIFFGSYVNGGTDFTSVQDAPVRITSFELGVL